MREDWWIEYGHRDLISAIRDPRVHACLVEGGIARFKRERGKVADRDPGDEDEVSP